MIMLEIYFNIMYELIKYQYSLNFLYINVFIYTFVIINQNV
jgi:hypothetical protein